MMTKTRRKAVDRLNGHDSREALWVEIRKLGTFTIMELRALTDLSRDTVNDYVIGLANGGFLSSDKDTVKDMIVKTPKRPVTYTLVRDVGVDAPRVRTDGTTVTQGQGVANMWRTMRILGTFSARELAVTASTESCVISEATARSYTGHLCQAGYLLKVKGSYRFRPTMYSGPKAPMIQRVKRVWDANLKKVMWSEDAITTDESGITDEAPPTPPSLKEGGGV